MPVVETLDDKLPKPALANIGDYIQINIQYECDRSYAIYRSINPDSGFEKIIDVDYKLNTDGVTCGGGALVDDYANSKYIYYKYILLDEGGNAVQESEVAEIIL